MTRASVLDAMGAEHIRTARAKGVGERSVVLTRHGLRNALIPVVTLIGLQIGFLLGGAVVTETVFSWPGVGRLAVGAILSVRLPDGAGHDPGAEPGGFILVNLAVDVLYCRHSTRGCARHDAPSLATDAPRSPGLHRPPAARPCGCSWPCCSSRPSCWPPCSHPGSRPTDPYDNDLSNFRCSPPGSPGLLAGRGQTRGAIMVTRLLFGLRTQRSPSGLASVALGGSVGALHSASLAAFWRRLDGVLMRSHGRACCPFPAILFGLAHGRDLRPRRARGGHARAVGGDGAVDGTDRPRLARPWSSCNWTTSRPRAPPACRDARLIRRHLAAQLRSAPCSCSSRCASAR